MNRRWVAAALIGCVAIPVGGLSIVQSPASTITASGALVISSTILAWLLGQVVQVIEIRPRTPISAKEASATPIDATVGQVSAKSAVPGQVKSALQNLRIPTALARSPLCDLAAIAGGDSTAAALRARLIAVVSEVAASSKPRDQEAGRLLLDYYVKGVGTHEVVMERLHLSRPTFYRRLRRGFELVGEQLDGLNGFVPVAWHQDMPEPYVVSAIRVEPLALRQLGITVR